MAPIRKLLLVCVGAFALHGLQACTGETELNPQPLPPQGGSEQTPPPADPQKMGDTTGVGGSSGSSGSSGTPPVPAADGGTDGGDGGTDGGDGGH